MFLYLIIFLPCADLYLYGLLKFLQTRVLIYIYIYIYIYITYIIEIDAMRKPCCDKQDINKGAWSKQEDQKLIDYINKHGEGCWRTLPKAAGIYQISQLSYFILFFWKEQLVFIINTYIYIYIYIDTHEMFNVRYMTTSIIFS